MTLLLQSLAQLLHAALMLTAAPLLAGLLDWLRARLIGHAGPPLLRPWHDLARLSRKQPVFPESVSPLFIAAPPAAAAVTLAAALLVPSFTSGLLGAPAADLLVIAGLLALARVIMALAAMDTGSAEAGLAASAATDAAILAEPAILLTVFALAALLGTSNLDAIAVGLRDGAIGLRVSLGLAFLALVTAGLAETAAPPPTLCYSGPPLALLQFTSALRRLVWLSLIAAIFCPLGLISAEASPLFWPLGLLAWVIKLGLLTLALALAGIVFALPPPRRMLGMALVLGLLAALLLFVGQGVT